MPSENPELYKDPRFQEAVQVFIEQYGHEPATDNDFEGRGGVLQIMEMMEEVTQGDGVKQSVLDMVMPEQEATTAPVVDDRNDLATISDEEYQQMLDQIDHRAISDVQQLLGGDFDSISHLLPQEYDNAVMNNDDDMRQLLLDQFIKNNPQAIDDAIAEMENR